jgi:hypothetical protein
LITTVTLASNSRNACPGLNIIDSCRERAAL